MQRLDVRVVGANTVMEQVAKLEAIARSVVLAEAHRSALTADNLFQGQTPAFFRTLMRQAQAADAAHRTRM